MEQRRFQNLSARMAIIPHGTVRNESATKYLPAGWSQFSELGRGHQDTRNAANTVAQNAAMVIPALAAWEYSHWRLTSHSETRIVREARIWFL